MASTSASFVQKSFFKYDVFISFRGEDTRKTFVDHLYHALVNKGIITYKDDERIEKGGRINDQLIKAIEESQFHIIVFSKNYASSSWCLDELVKIMECQKGKGQTAYPVFYDVEPTEVRKQSGAVGKAFAKHVKRGSWSSVLSVYNIFLYCRILLQRVFFFVDWFKWVANQEKEDDLRKWRNALKEAADLAGMELKNTVDGHEDKFIEKIIEEISPKLQFVNSNIDEKLVGMQIRVENLVSCIEIATDDVRMIGIKGMGGGGKTTLARAVFDYISIHFEGKSFVENVREGSKGSGLKELQKKILSDVLNDKSIDVRSVSDGKYMLKKLMRSVKVLLVLDDVDKIEQLEALAGELTWFKPGSRIIITTRDEQVLVAHRVHRDGIHDVNLLSDEEGICLLSRYAFGREIPNQGYEELSRKVVHYAAGLPLTLKVLGSFLCGRTEDEWDDAIKRLKTIPEDQTLKRLELSYNGLENDQKEIFLEVACILIGEEKDYAIRILESCGFNAKISLRVLEQKSLLTFSHLGELHMHDLIEEMGKNIVRRLHPDEPNKHSRLWIQDEIEDILVNESDTEAIRSIYLWGTFLHPSIIMKGIRKMKRLRLLYVSSYGMEGEIDEPSRYLPEALRSLTWWQYPFRFLPKTFQANKLANVEIYYSDISQLWKGEERKHVNKLRFLSLEHSKVSNVNLEMTPYLESLKVEACNELMELQMPVECPNLKSISLSGTKVNTLNLGMAPRLESLIIKECNELVELHLPAKGLNLKSLMLSRSKVSTLNLGMSTHLNSLYLDENKELSELYLPVECLNLKVLSLRNSKVRNLNLRMAPHLELLNIEVSNGFVELHLPVECPNFKSLNLSDSLMSTLNFGMTPHLEPLKVKDCKELVELHLPLESPNLKSFNLSGLKVSTLKLGMTPHLESLIVEGCKELVELHLPLESPNLKSFNVSGLKVSTLKLGMTPHLESLKVKDCKELVELHLPLESPNLKSFNLSGLKASTLKLGMTPHLESLKVKDCNKLVGLHLLLESPNLKSLNLSGLKVNTLNLGMTPHLKSLIVKGCNELVELHLPVECPNLEFLNLSGSKVSTLNLGMAPHVRHLELVGCCHLQEVHAPVGCLKNISYFNLSDCLRFKNIYFNGRWDTLIPPVLKLVAESVDMCPLHPNSNLPKLRFKCDYVELPALSSGNLEKLLSFGLCACTNLESFSASICGLQNLIVLTLEGSIPEVPKDLYQLQSLWRLTLSMKEIKHLPNSICMLKHLKALNLKSCWLLEQLPKELGQLEGLEELDLTECKSLRGIPNSICNMKCLTHLHLSYCSLVENLPEELGCLEHLKELHLEGAGISHLPQSIYQSKGLRIIGSRWRLESYGFTSLTEMSRFTSFCVV